MDDSNNEGLGCLFGCLGLSFTIGMGGVVYGNLQGVLAMLALTLSVNFVATICGFLPLIGQGIYWFVASGIVMPYVLNMFHIAPSWLTTLIFWMAMLTSIMTSFNLITRILKTISQIRK